MRDLSSLADLLDQHRRAGLWSFTDDVAEINDLCLTLFGVEWDEADTRQEQVIIDGLRQRAQVPEVHQRVKALEEQIEELTLAVFGRQQ